MDTKQNVLNKLAYLAYRMGDFSAARRYFERALAVNRDAVGPAHIDTAALLNNLALLLKQSGDYAAAKPFFEQSLAAYNDLLGPLHQRRIGSQRWRACFWQKP